jgi:hypothetical protein
MAVELEVHGPEEGDIGEIWAAAGRVGAFLRAHKKQNLLIPVP